MRLFFPSQRQNVTFKTLANYSVIQYSCIARVSEILDFNYLFTKFTLNIIYSNKVNSHSLCFIFQCFDFIPRLLQGISERLKEGLICPPSRQFYELRLLFLLTALRPELRVQLWQVTFYILRQLSWIMSWITTHSFQFIFVRSVVCPC